MQHYGWWSAVSGGRSAVDDRSSVVGNRQSLDHGHLVSRQYGIPVWGKSESFPRPLKKCLRDSYKSTSLFASLAPKELQRGSKETLESLLRVS